jgi:hypothetical protein
MEITFKCHVRKTSKISNIRPAEISITVETPDVEQTQALVFQAVVDPTINWVSASTTDDSADVTFNLPENCINTNLQFTIAVAHNDVLICGYDPVHFEIRSNPLWDGEEGPYDITGHRAGGGSMGNGSLMISAGQTVTFDAMYADVGVVLVPEVTSPVQWFAPPNCNPEDFSMLPDVNWGEIVAQPLTPEKQLLRRGDAASYRNVRSYMLNKYKDNSAFLEWASKN